MAAHHPLLIPYLPCQLITIGETMAAHHPHPILYLHYQLITIGETMAAHHPHPKPYLPYQLIMGDRKYGRLLYVDHGTLFLYAPQDSL